MSRVMVTGGSGFIGSHVVDALLASGHEVRNYDRRHSAYHRDGEIETVIGELTDGKTLRAAVEGCDAVIHLAAAADVGDVVNDPEEAERSNARGTIAVLEACRAAGVGRAVYGSTIWVYGESGDDPVTEGSGLGLPKHLYTASKLAGEMYCSSYSELYGLETTILRFGIPYGPRARPSTVIPTFVGKALAGEPLTITGDGAQSRRFVYVEDLADGIVRALRPEAANRIYNLASAETVTIRELAEIVRDEVRDVEIVRSPGRAGDFDGVEISCARAVGELDWAATTSIRDGVRNYLAWLHESDEPEIATAPAAPQNASDTVAGIATAVACAVFGSAVALALGAGFDLRAGQLHDIAITSAITALVAIALIPGRDVLRRDMLTAAAIAVLYGILIALPVTRHAIGLVEPSLAGALLSSLGATIGVSSLVVARRLLADDAAAGYT